VGVCGGSAAHDVGSLMQRADEAMYAAKTRGRNRIAVHGESDADVID
jgi:PleD family two-component response regulator